ncbi:hypothetical protein [Brevibacillus brevis]|uniref:hypothetical protein n=1 Tax=Brevibacillus brevis TaxID=1393 RepID=UPI0037CAC042
MLKILDLHQQRNLLLAALRHLRGIKRMRSDWGRLYANTLARLSLVEMQIEEMEKQKEA